MEPPATRGGERAQARRHDRRGDERQHRRLARAPRRGARLQVHLRDARQDEPGEDLEPARVRRQGRRLPHGRRRRGSALLLQGLAPHRRRDAQLVLREPVPQPREPRGALPLERARDLEADEGRLRRLRRRHGNGRHHQRLRQVLQGEEARRSSSSASIRLARSTTTSSRRAASPSRSRTRSKASARTSSRRR